MLLHAPQEGTTRLGKQPRIPATPPCRALPNASILERCLHQQPPGIVAMTVIAMRFQICGTT